MNPITWILRVLIRGYKLFISPVLPMGCRFYPTCSSYALEAIDTHGPLKGGWMGAKRIARCHPWNDGGVDLVPPADGLKSGKTHTHYHTCGHHHGHSET